MRREGLKGFPSANHVLVAGYDSTPFAVPTRSKSVRPTKRPVSTTPGMRFNAISSSRGWSIHGDEHPVSHDLLLW